MQVVVGRFMLYLARCSRFRSFRILVSTHILNTSDAYILLKETITVVRQGAHTALIAADRKNKPFTNCIKEINSTQLDYAKHFDVAIPMYNLIAYSNNYSKNSGSLGQYCRDEPNDNITDSKSLKFKSRFTNNTNNNGTVYVEIGVPLKYLSNF